MAKQYQMKKRMELLGFGLIINGKKWLLFLPPYWILPRSTSFHFYPKHENFKILNTG
jgi:hypothetical protein